MDYSPLDLLPLEIIDQLADSESTYRALLSYPPFARSITIGRRFDFMIKFGHDVKINKWIDMCIDYRRNGHLHRLDGPAREYENGDKIWFQNHQLHRVNEPVIEYKGSKEWWQNGGLHRLDGPAIEHENGDKEWFQHGQRHRLDGPAIEYTNGNMLYFNHGVAAQPPIFDRIPCFYRVLIHIIIWIIYYYFHQIIIPHPISIFTTIAILIMITGIMELLLLLLDQVLQLHL